MVRIVVRVIKCDEVFHDNHKVLRLLLARALQSCGLGKDTLFPFFLLQTCVGKALCKQSWQLQSGLRYMLLDTSPPRVSCEWRIKI